MFQALVLEERNGEVTPSIQSLDESRLPPGDVTVDVEYSTINYKDGMILRGLGRMVRQYPHIPGIDFAGTVTDSRDPRFRAGDKVILTGWRVGEAHWGGYAQKARVQADWLITLPPGLTTRRAMEIGTAGLTAMLAVMALEEHGLPHLAGRLGDHIPSNVPMDAAPSAPPAPAEVLITGATGGVGSIAVALLANLGHRVTASTGKQDQHDYLRRLGAAAIMDRRELSEPPIKPLDHERWAACIDNVGGSTLARVLSQMKWHGPVAAVGLAGSSELRTTLLPFLLRGVSLLGIDSNTCPTPRRQQAWQRLTEHLRPEQLDSLTTTAALSDLPRLAGEILAGNVRGRVVIDVNA